MYTRFNPHYSNKDKTNNQYRNYEPIVATFLRLVASNIEYQSKKSNKNNNPNHILKALPVITIPTIPTPCFEVVSNTIRKSFCHHCFNVVSLENNI